MLQSRSDTDLPAQMSSSHSVPLPQHMSNPQQRPSSGGDSSSSSRLLNPMDKMNDNARALSASGHLTPRPYKVQDVEPISPPSKCIRNDAVLVRILTFFSNHTSNHHFKFTQLCSD